MKWLTLTAALIALAFSATASAYEANWTGYAHTGADNHNLGYGYGYGNGLGGSYDIDRGCGCNDCRPSHATNLWKGFCLPKPCGPIHHGFNLFHKPLCCPPAPKCCGPTFRHRPIVSDCGCDSNNGCNRCRPKPFPVLRSLFHHGCGCGCKLFGWLKGRGCGCGCDECSDCGCGSGKVHGGHHDAVWSDEVIETHKPTPAGDHSHGEDIPLPPVGDEPMKLDSPETDNADPAVPAVPEKPAGSSALLNIRSLLGL